MQTLKDLKNLPLNESVERLDAWERLLLDIAQSISLPESLYTRLSKHYDAITDVLSTSTEPSLTGFDLFPQGSVLTRTLVRPLPGAEADVDAIAFRETPPTLTPCQWLDTLHTELNARARTQGTVKRKRRCVTVSYDDSVLPAHVDVTPAIPTRGNDQSGGAGPLEVPDYPSNTYHPTNPKDFAAWVTVASEMELPLAPVTTRLVEARTAASVEAMPSHEDMIAMDPLRLIIKLAKRHRDIFARDNHCEETRPISVVLTTLITKAYMKVVQDARVQRREFTIVQALREIVRRMRDQFDRIGPGLWQLSNPMRASENFVEKWHADPALATTFFDWHNQFQGVVDLGLYSFEAREDFVHAIESAFGLEPKRASEKMLTEAAVAGSELPGLTAAEASRLRPGAKVGSTLLGLASQEPSRAQKPQDLGRLG